MASITLTLTGNSSQLQAEYFPSIDLSDGSYVCGLIDFQTFNSIPNVDETNNLFYCGHDTKSIKKKDNSDDKKVDVEISTLYSNDIPRDIKNDKSQEMYWKYTIDGEPTDSKRNKRAIGNNPVKNKLPMSYIEIPIGSYEVDDLSRLLKRSLQPRNIELELHANKNTLQCELLCSQPIDFSKPRTIGPLLGFQNNAVLPENIVHISPLPADILKISVIRIECDIVAGSYLNNRPSHTIHEFSPRVPPGYKIIEVPQNVIYFPVTVKNIHALNVSVIDQSNNLINFRGETITIRLHIKKLN